MRFEKAMESQMNRGREAPFQDADNRELPGWNSLKGTRAAADFTVFIRDLAVETTVGVYEHERLAPTRLLMDLELGIRAVAGRSDLIADTVDYAEVVASIREALAEQHFRLLECLAEFVVGRLAADFPVDCVRLRVAKTGILKDVGQVGVIAERHFATSEAPARKVNAVAREFW
jgi:dihydroneopterin aldolase